jgi:phage head maturation protease
MVTTRERLSGKAEVLEATAGPRRFRMVANTGAEFTRASGLALVDLSGVDVPGKLPILLNHDEDAVVGYADSHELTPEGLVLSGVLLTDEPAGERVARLSAAGYPWTASVGVEINKVERLAEGQTAKCNGRDVSGPVSVWRRSALFESSFVTANPADKSTSAVALAKEFPMTPTEFEQAHPEAVKAWKDEAAKAERASLMGNLGALLTAIPNRPEFVLAQFSEGADVLKAKAALCDVLTAEAVEAKAVAATPAAPSANPVLDALKAKAGNPGLGFSGDARENAETLASLDPLERAKRELANTPGLRGMKPEHLAAFYRAEAAGQVRADTVTRTASAFGGQ